jgi:serine/threonine protein kinase
MATPENIQKIVQGLGESPEARSYETDLTPEEVEALVNYLEQRTPLSQSECEHFVGRMSKNEAWQLLKTLHVGSQDLITLIEERPPGPDDQPNQAWRQGSNVGGTPLYLVNQTMTQSGGMAQVLPAFNFHMGRREALKKLPVQLAGNTEYMAMLKREAIVHAQNERRGILQVNNLLMLPEGPVLVLRYMDPDVTPTMSSVMKGIKDATSKTVDLTNPITNERLNGKVVFSPDRILQFVQSIGAGLQNLHNQGIVHLDLKPGNIFLSAEPGGDVVADFGLANTVFDPSVSFGTPRYMAPEKAMRGDVDGRTDMYSLAVIVYEMMTGQPILKGDNSLSLALDTLALTQEMSKDQSRLNTDMALFAYCRQYTQSEAEAVLMMDRLISFFRNTLCEINQRLPDMEAFEQRLEHAFEPAQP